MNEGQAVEPRAAAVAPQPSPAVDNAFHPAVQSLAPSPPQAPPEQPAVAVAVVSQPQPPQPEPQLDPQPPDKDWVRAQTANASSVCCCCSCSRQKAFAEDFLATAVAAAQ